MRNLLTAVEDVPLQQGEGVRPVEWPITTEKERWENEGGAAGIGRKEPVEASQPVSKDGHCRR